MSKMKIGIMGGTFNPIHYGHLILAQEALEQCDLDKVLFIPSGKSYMKDERKIVDGIMRYEMVERAICGNDKFFISDIELRRAGNTYTYETLLELEVLYPGSELFFIIGDDTLFTIESWYQPQIIFEHCTLVAAIREHADLQLLEAKRKELKDKYKASIILLKSSQIEISSTMIRDKISNRNSVQYLLPDAVRDYIKEHELYIG